MVRALMIATAVTTIGGSAVAESVKPYAVSFSPTLYTPAALDGRVTGSIRYKALAFDLGVRGEYYGSLVQVDGVLGARLFWRDAYVGAQVGSSIYHFSSEGLESVRQARGLVGLEKTRGAFLYGFEFALVNATLMNDRRAIGAAARVGVAF